MPTHYVRLGIALAINAVVMYFVMYAMLDELAHYYFSLDRIYMVLLMVMPMLVVMLLLMRGMYRQRALNGALLAGAVAVFIASFLLVRQQGLIGNEQFLRAMIPHHSSAILMCERAALTDAEILRLCEQIVRSQREEIAQMQALLRRP